MRPEAVLDLHVFRRELYNLLRHLYWKSPEPELIENVREYMERMDLEDDSSLGAGWKLTREVIRSNSDARLLADRLGREYTRLFIGPGKTPVSPYETLYRSESRLLMQETALDVRKSYLEAGLVMEHLYSTPDDHLAAEMEFMYYLCDKTVEKLEQGEDQAAERYLELQRKFLNEHLLHWVPKMAEELKNAAGDPFYKGVSLITRGLMETEAEMVLDN
ncbi:hypothetical protein SY88_10250 [Clostridiales bacterium PH28_bin88]|nr:hypothetical protein SY88_10250 [Clostridiales bacterium PH28_bin88]